MKGVGGSGFLTEVASIEAGQAHSVAAKAAGTVWAWGLGTDGRLGNGGTAQQNAPVQSGTLTLVTQVAAGDKHTLAHATFAQSQLYGYDRVYRLTGENADSYAYDPVGNRSGATVRGVSTAYSYDRADRITAAGATPYTVNAAGNLTARGADSFSYDQANRLTGATVAGTTATYTYDGDGIRVARTQGTTTGYVHDRAAGLPTVIDDGARRYVQGPNGLAYSLAGSALSVHHVDALGSVRALSDSAAALTQRYGRDAWGTQTATQGSSTQPFGFTGEHNDAASGLLHLRARDYDPLTGRFMQRDTFAGRLGKPLSLHRFGYAFNNPVSLRDPSGRDPLIDGGTGTGCLSCDVMADAAAVVAAPAPAAPAPALEPASVSAPTTGTTAATPADCQMCSDSLGNLIRFGPGANIQPEANGVIVVTGSTSGLFGGVAYRVGTFVPNASLIISRHGSIPGDSYLLRHELAHIAQAREMGLGYLPGYLRDYVLTAGRLRTFDHVLIHRSHPMEIDADRRALP